MAINVELFDGTILEFPDGTDQSVVLATGKRMTLERQMAAEEMPRNELGEIVGKNPEGSRFYQDVKSLVDPIRPYVEPVTDYFTKPKTSSVLEGTTLGDVRGERVLPPSTDVKRRTFEAASPQERLALAQRDPDYKNLFDFYAAKDQALAEPQFEGYNIPDTRKLIDTRAEKRRERMIAEGVSPETATNVARYAAREGMAGASPLGIARPLNEEELAAEQARVDYKPGTAGALSRIGGKSKEQYKAAVYGGLRFVGDMAEELGADEFGQRLAGGAGGGQKRSESILKGIGENPDKALNFIESGVSGAINNFVPFLAGPTVGLSVLGTQVFGQEYGQGRDAGLNKVDAVARASAMTTAEIIGESASLPTPLFNVFKKIADKVPVDQIMPEFGRFLIKENLAEQVTTALQFSADKFAPFGIRPGATFQDYLQAVYDTFYQTMAQTLVTGGGGVLAGQAIRMGKKPTQAEFDAQEELRNFNKTRTTIEQDLEGMDIIYPEDAQYAAPIEPIEIRGVGQIPADEATGLPEDQLIADLEESQDRQAMLAELEDERDLSRQLQQETVQKKEAPAVELTPAEEKAAPAEPVAIKAMPQDEFLAKVQNPEIAGELQAMAANAGWAQVGGRIIRENMEDNTSKVTGRTTWIPKEEWWRGRPKGMTEAKTNKAVQKAIAGEQLNIPEKRMIEYMVNVAEGNVGRGAEERARLEESDRQVAQFEADRRVEEARVIADRFAQMGQQGPAQAIIKAIEEGKPVTPEAITFLRSKLQDLSQPAPMELTGQTPDEARAQAAELEKQQADEQRVASEQQRAEQEARDRAEIARRSEGAAEDFQLGQTAEENLTGQKNVFAEPTTKSKAVEIEDVIKDGIDRYAASLIKNRVKDIASPESMGATANAALNRVIDNVETKLKALGVSKLRDDQGNTELEKIIYGRVIPGGREKAFKQPEIQEDPDADIPFDNSPMFETIKSKPGANVARIANLLGPQLYGSMSDITSVSVKEMLQNSFDAIKTMLEQKKMDAGLIDIVLDKDQRTIAMTDDGSGMSPDTLANTFLTIAGTKKDTEFGSGGFGIAKMLFLFGNKNVEVVTMKDGKISSMSATGEQLMAALEDPSKAPDIQIDTKNEIPDWEKMFPKGHGTFVRVTVPETFKDKSTGEEKEVDFSDSVYSFDSLQNSPLFANISVRFNDRAVYDMGDMFPANEYTTFVDAKFNWGTARIYVSNAQKDKYGSNLHVLSNGLFQFSESLKSDPTQPFGNNIPHRFYLDVVSKVKPDEEGYPFQLNRQGFTKEAEKDLKLIQNYLVLHYRQKDYSTSVQNFGTVQYLSKSGKTITASALESLVPDIPETETKEGIKEGAKVEVKDGKLIVNGKVVPLLTPEDLKNASIDISSLRIPQDKIDPNKVMIHDNLEVAISQDKRSVEEKRARQAEIGVLRAKLQTQIFELEDADYVGNQTKIKELEEERLKLYQEADLLYDEIVGIVKPKDLDYVPITTLAREKFGDRFDSFMFDIGDTLAVLRDGVASLMPADKNGVNYSKLATEAVGISFDKEYRGVSITLPFNGLFINPAFPEYVDTPEEAAIGMFGTMIHELAHHKVRNHNADFPAEMQRILIKLESAPNFDIQRVKKELISSVKDNMDIIKFLNKEGSNELNRPIGKRFKDSQQQSRGEDTSEDVPGSRQEQRREPRVSGKPGQRDTAAEQKQKSESIPPSGKASKVTWKNYKGGPASLANWKSPEDSKLDNWLYKIQDKLIDTKRVQQAIEQEVGELEDNWNAYMKEELYHGRTAKRTQDFLKDELLPIVKELAKNNIEVTEFETFLHNRHAEERNISNAKRNPAMPDGGSGILTADAKQYLADLDPAKRKIYEKLADKIDAIVKGSHKILVAGGDEEQSTVDIWEKAYKHYVPLERDELDFVNESSGLGQGFSTRGSFSARSVGSKKNVIDIFANIALQRERAIIRVEKMRIGRALMGLAIKNPDPDFWLVVNPDAIKNKDKLAQELIDLGLSPEDAKNIAQEPKSPYTDPLTGLVSYRINPRLRNSDNVFPVRVNGKDRFIFFRSSNERAMRMVSALKNLNVGELEDALSIVANLTRWFASVNTQYNPVFGIINFSRDVQGAALNLTTTKIADKKKEVIAGTFPALRAIYKTLRSDDKQTGDWAALWEDFQKEGAQTGYRDQFSRSRRQASIIERETDKLNRGRAKRYAYAVAQWLSDYNDALENAVRLSAYKVALDKGLSKQQAASIAKNLTVNFNRKGIWTQTVNAFYAFFNAAVQGTTRLVQTMKGPAGRKIFYGGVTIGALQAVGLAMAGFDEDDPPEFIKSRNLIFPTGGKTYISIPMPLGFNVFPNLGRLTTEFVLSGGKNPAKKSLQLASMIFNTFNPIGGSGLQLFAPTIADPFVALETNVDPFGRPISKKDRVTAPTPGYLRSREESSTVSKYIAEFLNYATGGTEYQKGEFSPTADQIDYLAGQATGGVGREIMKTVGLAKSLVTGDELPPYKVPIVGKFYGNAESPANIASKFYDNVTQLANYENEIKGRRKNNQNVGQFMREHPETSLYQRANRLENQITEINRDKKELQQNKAPQKQIDVLDKRKTALMDKFNKDYKKLAK